MANTVEQVKCPNRPCKKRWLTGDESYAQSASNFLKTWFLNGATKMNPNMNFAQGIPGKSNGAPTGIIDGWGFISVVDSVHMLEGSKAWNNQDDQGIKQWFTEYLTWLRKSKAG